MKLRYIFSSLVFVLTAMVTNITAVKTKDTEVPDSIKNIIVKNMEGKDVKLSDYAGKVLLIVNVASNCGYTPQYQGLEAIYEKYKGKGFEILAFPCNDFGGQEPGTNEEIKNFCSVNYKVSFSLFDKIKVLGPDKAPLYKLLTNSPAVEQGDIKWNFEKFLIDKNGDIKGRFRSQVKPESEELTKAIEAELMK